ncbi:MAG: hypothetical protein N2Z81_06305 [Hydrogenothermaceae bacterium]|nr:hypothetical protein [Hydrogenothermaceae bacterium]
MNPDRYIKAMNYHIEQAVALYLKGMAYYNELEQEIENLKKKVDILDIKSATVFGLMSNIEYIKSVLEEIEYLEKEKEKLKADLDELREDIKLRYGQKKAFEILIKKYKEKEEMLDRKKEIEVAEEVYRSKLINSK